MTVFDFMLGTLATWRLSLLLSQEDGPMFIFRKLRQVPDKRTALRKGISCQLCVSVWFSALVTGFHCWRGSIAVIDTPLYWLAFSAGAIACHMTWTKGL